MHFIYLGPCTFLWLPLVSLYQANQTYHEHMCIWWVGTKWISPCRIILSWHNYIPSSPGGYLQLFRGVQPAHRWAEAGDGGGDGERQADQRGHPGDEEQVWGGGEPGEMCCLWLPPPQQTLLSIPLWTHVPLRLPFPRGQYANQFNLTFDPISRTVSLRYIPVG